MESLGSFIKTIVIQNGLSLLRCKVVFDQDFLRWPDQTFYTSRRKVNILSCSAHASKIVKPRGATGGGRALALP